MFPKCANPECLATFGTLREGNLFRFRRHSAAGAPPNSHSVEHAWLCARCCETNTLEYSNNSAVLVALAPPVQAAAAPLPMRKRSRGSRSLRRRPRTRLAPPQSTSSSPVVLLAITATSDFSD